MDVHVIDADAALELARRGHVPGGDHEFFAPTLLRSQVLAAVRARVVGGDPPPDEALSLAERACSLPRRLLGDKVLRRVAWQLALEHDWPDTYDAEYVALTRLHGTGLVAGSDTLRARAAPLVPTATVEDFLVGR